MIDFYLHADEQFELFEDLAALGLMSEDGAPVTASEKHALDYLGQVIDTPAEIDEEGNETAPAIFLPGVYAALRCLDDAFAAYVYNSGVSIVDKPQGVREWA